MQKTKVYVFLLLIIALFQACGDDDNAPNCQQEDLIGKWRPITMCNGEPFEVDLISVDEFTLVGCTFTYVDDQETLTLELDGDMVNYTYEFADGTTEECVFERIDFNCDCAGQAWNPSSTYSIFDIVEHDGMCWEAVAQGNSTEPGPWLVNGNDIWKLCEE